MSKDEPYTAKFYFWKNWWQPEDTFGMSNYDEMRLNHIAASFEWEEATIMNFMNESLAICDKFDKPYIVGNSATVEIEIEILPKSYRIIHHEYKN